MLRISKIAFPGLGIGEFSVDSVAFTLFGNLDIAWYAIIITCGMIAAIAYAVTQAKKIGITFEDVIKDQVIEELRGVDINTLSPYEAMTMLFNLQKRIK